MSDAPDHIRVRWGKSGDVRISGDRFIPPDTEVAYTRSDLAAAQIEAARLEGQNALIASEAACKLAEERLAKAVEQDRALMLDALVALVSAMDTIRKKWATTNPAREKVILALSEHLGVEVVPARAAIKEITDGTE